MTLAALAMVLSFVCLLIFGVPIVFSLGLAAVVGFLTADINTVVLTQRVIAGTQVSALLAIPGFILAGELMVQGGLARKLVTLSETLIGHVRGGLAMVAVVSATLFAALSGSAPATTAAIGGIMIPEMEKRGYPKDFSAGLAAVTGPLGQMIPPSIPFIIWGALTGESITKLFLAGIIPGLMITTGLIIYCYSIAKKLGVESLERSSFNTIIRALNDSKWALLVPVIILGGIYGGIFTPTEASAVGVAYGLVISLFVYREITYRDLYRIILQASKTTAIVCFIIAMAASFGWLVARMQLPGMMAEKFLSLSDNPYIALLLLNLLLFFVGMVMDTTAAMIILVGMLVVLGQKLGLDPTHLGAIVVINFAVGMASPPFGYTIFVSSAMTGLTVVQISKRMIPMLLIAAAVVLLMTYIPSIALYLPGFI
ncbi:MAG: TRAP transporter large permease [Desulfocapsaceae bacterium]